MFVENLYAAGKGAAPSGGAAIAQFLPLILIFVVFYFLLIRPQQKKAKEHREMLNNLKKGDEVITAGGIIGKIVGITNDVITLEISDNVKIKVSRGFISSKIK
jgi:preprotein translocase subunit YajC